MKKIICILLTCCLLAGAVPALAVDAGEARAVIGANLTEQQIADVYANFGVERVFYVPSMQLSGLIGSPDGKNVKKGRVYGKHYRKQCNLKGIESYSPRAGRVIN